MLARLEDERRESGRAVLRAQEQERSRIAQDLHDEVNQALTAILLRLSATIGDAPWGLRSELQETQELVSAGDGRAARARPPAAPDRARRPRPHRRARVARSATSASARACRPASTTTARCPTLSDEEQLVIFRVTQESLSNIAKHATRARRRRRAVVRRAHAAARARRRRRLRRRARRSASNGRVRGRPGGLGLSGMRERALLVGGNLDVFTAPGAGTTIELTMGVT